MMAVIGYVLAGLCLFGAVIWALSGEWLWCGVLVAAAAVNFYYAGVNRREGL